MVPLLPERAAEVAHLCSKVFPQPDRDLEAWRFVDASQPLSKLLKLTKKQTLDGKEEERPPIFPPTG